MTFVTISAACSHALLLMITPNVNINVSDHRLLPLPVSPLVEVVVVLRPLDVDELLVLLLVGFAACDGEILHVPQGLP